MPSPMHTIEIFTNSAHFLNLEKIEKLLFRFSRRKEEIKQKPKEFLLAFWNTSQIRRNIIFKQFENTLLLPTIK